MKFINSFFLFSFLVCTAAQARLTDDQVLISIISSKIEVTTKAGFHINAEAPASAIFDNLEMLAKPTVKTEKLISFEVPPKTKKAKISFYVCDDKKTVCEQHRKDVALTQTDSVAAAYVPAAKKEVAAVLKTDTDKPTLLIFSAPWCPACLRMQTEVYPQSAIKNEFKKLQVTKLNIDLPENAEMSDKFHVRAIPTLILLNQSGQEVTRWLDFQPAAVFASDLKQHVKNSTALAELEKKAKLGDAAAISAMGMNAYNAMNFSEAVMWLSQSKKIVDLNYKLAAEISLAEEKDEGDGATREEHLNALQKGLTLTLSQMDQYRWTTELIELLKEKKDLSEETKLKAKNTIENFKLLLKDEAKLEEAFAESTLGNVGRFAKEEVLLMKARLCKALGETKEQEEAHKAIIALIEKKKFTTEKSGEMLLAIAYLREAKNKELVEKYYQQLLAKYPETYVYHEKYGRYLLKEKNLENALKETELALKFPEGNEPQLYLLKARILKEMNNKPVALSTLDQALGLQNIDHKRYKKTVAQIETLKKELSSGSTKQ